MEDQQPKIGPRPIEGARSAIGFVVEGRRRALAQMSATAFLGGIAEALFLITVTRAAFAITNGREQVGIVAGRSLSVNLTLILALTLVLCRIALSSFAVWQSTRLATEVVARIRQRLARAFMRSSWELQQEQNAGSFQELVVGYSNNAASLMNGTTQGIIAMANLIALLGLAVAVDPAGALVMVVSVAVLGLALRPLRKAVRRRSSEALDANLEVASAVNEVSQLGMELHVFHVQDVAERRIGAVIDEARSTAQKVQFAAGTASTIYSGLAYLALVAALAVVAASAEASLTTLGAVMLVMLRSLSYGQALQAAYLTVTSSAPAVEKLTERTFQFERGRRTDGGQAVGEIGTIRVENVTFAYTGESDVLHDVTLTIPPREIVGIVGPSGSGKSTLVQLLLGLRDAEQGTITADGRNISIFDKAQWARKVTFVPQSAHLVAGSIADNIRFLREEVTDDEITEASKAAHLHGDIIGFPDGYDRQVGEQGGHLSGGQQQRLCIARALVEKPDVLILDEPTSALDVKSEHLIRSTLLGLKKHMTVIVIAHRLSTLDVCDRIMVIQDGRVRGFDTPANLRRSNEFYREALQLSGLS